MLLSTDAEFQRKLDALLDNFTEAKKVIVYVASAAEGARLRDVLNADNLVAELAAPGAPSVVQQLAIATFKRREKTKFLIGGRNLAVGWRSTEGSTLVFWDPEPSPMELLQLVARVSDADTIATWYTLGPFGVGNSAMHVDDAILSFAGEYRWLSNFWPVTVKFDSLEFATTEHAYQAAKADRYADRLHLSEDGGADLSPGQAKAYGQNVNLSPLWNDDTAMRVMLDLTRQKYDPARNPALTERLLATGDARIVEGNTWHDNRWGDCTCGKYKECLPRGMNWLGSILMQVREELRLDA